MFYLSWTNGFSVGGQNFPCGIIWQTVRADSHGGKNLFKTYIGEVLQLLRAQKNLKVRRMAPRYYNEFSFLMNIPVAREFLAWNCALQVEKVNEE